MSEYSNESLCVSTVDTRNWEQVIQQSGLPEPVRVLIHQTVGKTRLWRKEKAGVARELVAHFADALADDEPVEQVIERFGEAKVAARLMRRAKKRNRPLWWRVGRRMAQGVAVVMVLYVAQMAILLTGRPEPKIDYGARLCQKAEAIAEADRAWPIYRQAWLSDTVYVKWPPTKNGKPLRDSRPGDANWGQVVAMLQQHPILLEAARVGGMEQGMGITIQERRGLEGTQYRKIFPVQPQCASLTMMRFGTLVALDCPEQGAIMEMVRLLSLDIRLAATQNDARRIVQDYRAIAGMFRQVRETPTFIGQLMVLIYTSLVDQTLAEVLIRNPDLLSAQQYVELLHTMAGARDAIGVTTESLRAEMGDLLQHVFTDNGSGDGRLTRQGAEVFLANAGGADQQSLYPSTSVMALPLLSACTVSRREMTQMVEKAYDLMDRDFALPLRQMVPAMADPELDQIIQETMASPVTKTRYWPLSILIPQFTSVGKDVHIARAKHDGLTVALALEAYRRTNGRYPENLDMLAPRYLPSVPLDPLANQPLLYALHDGKPVIYTRGQDGKDRGGTPSSSQEAVPASADWILFPPPEVR